MQSYRRAAPTPSRLRPTFAGTALLAAAAVRLGRGPVGQAALLFQLIQLTSSVVDLVEVTGQARQAAHLRQTVEHNLQRVHARLVAAESSQRAPGTAPVGDELAGVDPAVRAVVDRVRAGHVSPPAAAATPPLPNSLEPATRPRTADAGRIVPDLGPDR